MQKFSVKALEKDDIFQESGYAVLKLSIRGKAYKFMLIRDGEGIYTVAEGNTIHIIGHTASAPEAVSMANTVISNLEQHDLLLINDRILGR